MAASSHQFEENEQAGYKYRTSLPMPMPSKNDSNIWSVLKNCIGPDITKITTPVILSEPLSFLQRITEYMEYAELLKIASEQEEPVDRMKYIAGFAVSALSSNWGRIGNPFNALLGETFELDRPDFKILCEQVSHNPPVSAFHAESPSFKFHGSIHAKKKFWGKSVKVKPKGSVKVELSKWNELYTWTNVKCFVHNIIVGKLWVEQYGTMEIVNNVNGLRTVLTFKPAGNSFKDLHRVEGFIMDKNEKKLHFLYGKWTEFIKCININSYEEFIIKDNSNILNCEDRSSFQNALVQESYEPPEHEIPKCDSSYSIDIPQSFTIWKADPRPPNTSEFYQFTLFAMSLNEMVPGTTICPTDSRFRPDIRKLECGDIDGAALEKTRLEEKRRDARKSKKSKKGEEFTPRWFKLHTDPGTKQEEWIYAGGYWDRKYEMSNFF